MKGYVIGPFYDDQGRPTDALKAVEEGARQAEEIKAQREAAKKLNPTCNSRWAQGKGMRIQQGFISVMQEWRQVVKYGARWDIHAWWLSTSLEQTRRNVALVLKRQVIQSSDSYMRTVPQMPRIAAYHPKTSDLDGVRWMLCLEKRPNRRHHTFSKRVRHCKHISNCVLCIYLTALSCSLFAVGITFCIPRAVLRRRALLGLFPMKLHTFLDIPMRCVRTILLLCDRQLP